MPMKYFLVPILMLPILACAKVDSTVCTEGAWIPGADSSNLCLKISGDGMAESLNMEYFIDSSGKKISLTVFSLPSIKQNEGWVGEVADCKDESQCRWKFFTSGWIALENRKAPWIDPKAFASIFLKRRYTTKIKNCDGACDKKNRKEILDSLGLGKQRYVVLFKHPNELFGPFVYSSVSSSFIDFDLDW